jgi:hypothetical protein
MSLIFNDLDEIKNEIKYENENENNNNNNNQINDEFIINIMYKHRKY